MCTRVCVCVSVSVCVCGGGGCPLWGHVGFQYLEVTHSQKCLSETGAQPAPGVGVGGIPGRAETGVSTGLLPAERLPPSLLGSLRLGRLFSINKYLTLPPVKPLEVSPSVLRKETGG